MPVRYDSQPLGLSLESVSERGSITSQVGGIHVFFWSITTETLVGDLELVGCIAMRQKREDPDKNPNGGSIDTLQASDINGLRVISGKNILAKPMAY